MGLEGYSTKQYKSVINCFIVSFLYVNGSSAADNKAGKKFTKAIYKKMQKTKSNTHLAPKEYPAVGLQITSQKGIPKDRIPEGY